MSAVTATTARPARPAEPRGPAGFGHLVRAEWTKLRTVRGWLFALLAAALVMVLFGLLPALGSQASCRGGCRPALTVGPDGEAVSDSFYFVHQSLIGDGSLSVRVSSLTGLVPADPTGPSAGGSGGRQGVPGPRVMRAGLDPWAKAGLIVKASTASGAAYAAIMITGDHGVRMQSNFTQDTAASAVTGSAASPGWLRLTRSGNTLIGEASADGSRWTRVAAVNLAGKLSSTVQAGLFVTSPRQSVTEQHFGGASSTDGPTVATASFDHLSVRGQRPSDSWTGTQVGGISGDLQSNPPGPFRESGGTFTVTGAGDIAPRAGGPEPNTFEGSLVGTFAGLIVVIVLGTTFMTAEYRRGLIRTTMTASPHRVRLLAAKALVLGTATFAAALLASTLAIWLVGRTRRTHGNLILPVTTLTAVRVVVGTAALVAVIAVLALAVGTILRRSTGAVTLATMLVVVPYILSVAQVLPVPVAQWVLRVTPAAGFAIQQSIPHYSQVAAAYTPSTGYFPLPPWAGFAVLCAWAALALGLAAVLLRRRDV